MSGKCPILGTNTIVNILKEKYSYIGTIKMVHIPNKVVTFETEFPNVTFMQVSDDAWTIIDERFQEKILKYKWYLQTTSGYIAHRFKSTGDIPVANNKTHMYLHQFIMQSCLGIEPNQEGYSVDHINWKKPDNRSINLRYVSQSVQNTNREMFHDRKKPPQELIDLGISEFPKHLRYDNSQSRFIIEKHPQLLAEGKKQISGTRKGSMLNRYYDVILKGIELDKTFSIEQHQMNSVFLEAFHSFTKIANHFNENMEGEAVFDVKLPQVRPTFQGHSHLIGSQHDINTQFTVVSKEAKGIVSNGNVVCEDDSMTLTKDMIPKYVSFSKETEKRGCKFTYNRKISVRKMYSREMSYTKVSKELSSGSKLISLKVKFETMCDNLKSMLDNDSV
jgi:hypothetical protein